MKVFKKILLLLFLFAFQIDGIHGKDVLKVLAIGNSFSEDAVEQYLYELAAAQGDSLVIGNAYIGGCSIDRHWNNAQSGKADYEYRKVVGGVRYNRKKVTLKEIICDECWDIITFQQASHYSGKPETYVNLGKLCDYVRKEALNPKVRFAFHMTWAYSKDSDHGAFKDYGNNQMKMYHAICQSVKAVPQYGIKKIIPTGIAIQNAREAIGDKLTRDGYHLERTVGRYTAACTWCQFLTKEKITKNPYYPVAIDSSVAVLLRKSAQDAFRKRKKVL
ncbi:MAG TPA: DUF4886 domain-containing protein [Prevotellaceae bacterium]|nr:DUF4886 domain-containing protein [Prevotellaceae bacterium]